MDRKQLEQRTKAFHIAIIQLCDSLPRNAVGFETTRQIIRSAGSIGANYRATKRARSVPDFINKIGIVLEEADESLYWLEVIRDARLSNNTELRGLIAEAGELTAIFAATDKTIKQKRL